MILVGLLLLAGVLPALVVSVKGCAGDFDSDLVNLAAFGGGVLVATLCGLLGVAAIWS